MSSTSNPAARTTKLDPLEFLPCSTVFEYSKGQVIYQYGEPCDSVYLVLSGLVKVTAVANYDNQFLVDLYGQDDLFGDLGLTGQPVNMQQATAFHDVTLMRWQTDVIQEIILRRPQLAIALLQTFGNRMQSMKTRLGHFCFEPIINRLVRALLRFSTRTGMRQPDGTVLMEPMTHEMLAQYVGTSREVVTCHMVDLRRLGLVEYSRRVILLHPQAMEAWLESGWSDQHKHNRPQPEPRTFSAGASGGPLASLP